MNEAFGRGLTMVNKCEATLNVAVAELGAKYNRLQMTQDRLSDEKTDTEEKLSNNEDMDNCRCCDRLDTGRQSASGIIIGYGKNIG